jgi:ABC-type arginine/histidine transport system permease subunit
LWDNGKDDEAFAVRVLWLTLRDNLACASLAATLADVARNAKLLAKVAREMERRAGETLPDETRTDG